jgi:hypothetical protein
MASTRVSLNEKLMAAHSYMISNNLDVRDLLNIVVTNRDGAISFIDITDNPDADTSGYELAINYNELTLKFSDTYDKDFSVSLYVNRPTYETISKALAGDPIFLKDKVIAVFRININGTDYKVPVYDLPNPEDIDPIKSVRIKTAYGTGYVGLVDEDTSVNAPDQYKICIGFEGETPIVKSLELVQTEII